MGTFFARNGLLSLPPVLRRFLLIAIDALLLPLAVWLSFWLRLAHPFHPSFLAAGVGFVGRNPCWPSSLCLHGAIQRSHPLRGQCCPLSPCRPQRTAGTFAGHQCDNTAADATPQQLILLWLLLTGFTGSVLCLGCVAQPALHAARQQLRVAIYGAGEAGADWPRRCVWRATTGSSPSSTTTRPIGIVPSTGLRFNRPRNLLNSATPSIRCCWRSSLPRSERHRIVDQLQGVEFLCCRCRCG